jgi:hypothetical protein
VFVRFDHVARFIENPSQAFAGDDSASGKKKAGLELLQASYLTLTSTLRFSSGSYNAYGACGFDRLCGSRAAQYCNTFGNMENRRSSRNSCAGNTHTHIPDIRSRNDMRDNRIRPRLLRCRLKPERQLVLLAPKPVRLLPMEVKAVFSYILLFMNFPVVCVFAEGLKAPHAELTGACENRASSLFI